MDRETKKALKKQWAQQQRATVRSTLPLGEDAMRAMFDWLEEALPDCGCDHSRRLTTAWLQEHGHPVEAVSAWLDNNGGFCDCEVLANAADRFEDAVKPTDSRGAKH